MATYGQMVGWQISTDFVHVGEKFFVPSISSLHKDFEWIFAARTIPETEGNNRLV